jgi:hypothetical protein
MNADPLPLFLKSCSFISNAQRTFLALQFAHPMTQKSLNMTNEMGKYWKVFDDTYMLGDGRFYPT